MVVAVFLRHLMQIALHFGQAAQRGDLTACAGRYVGPRLGQRAELAASIDHALHDGEEVERAGRSIRVTVTMRRGRVLSGGVSMPSVGGAGAPQMSNQINIASRFSGDKLEWLNGFEGGRFA
jgi:hypothetical protein